MEGFLFSTAMNLLFELIFSNTKALSVLSVLLEPLLKKHDTGSILAINVQKGPQAHPRVASPRLRAIVVRRVLRLYISN